MNKKYWLRGGMLGLVVGTILIAFALFFRYVFGSELLTAFVIPGLYASPFLKLFGCYFISFRLDDIPAYCPALSLAVLIAANLILYIIAGILIGWIYGKMKNRRNVTNNVI